MPNESEDTKFVYLNVKSNYSVLNQIPATSSPEELVKTAQKLEHRQLALTDTNWYGLGRFFTATRKYNIKPLPGIQLPVDMGLTTPEMHALFLPQNNAALRRLFVLGNKYTRDKKLLTPHDLEEISDNTIILTNGNGTVLRELIQLDNVFYTINSPTHANLQKGIKVEEKTGKLVVAHEVNMAPATDLPVLRFLEQAYGTQDQYRRPLNHILKRSREVQALYFPLPSGLARTREIAESIHVELPSTMPLRAHLVPEGEDASSYLTKLVAAALENNNRKNQIKGRVHTELSLIHQLKFADYILICKEIVDYCKKSGITYMVTGSGNNSVVLWLLGITSVDAAELYFERFINLDRLDFPDIDFDLPYYRRAEVMQFLSKRYPSTLLLSVIHHYKSESITQLSKRKNIEVDNLTKKMAESANIPSTISTHPSGVIFAANLPMSQIGQHAVAQIDKDDADNNFRIPKIDLLSRPGIGKLDRMRNFLKQDNITPLISFEDPITWRKIFSANTVGITYIESPHLRAMLKIVGNRSADYSIGLLAQVQALARPGVDTRKRFYDSLLGIPTPLANYPEIAAVLKNTNYAIIYQEQVIKVATDIAGLSRRVGDKLRKMMSEGKAKPEQYQLLSILKKALSEKYPQEVIDDLVEQTQSFMGYGFVEGHSQALSQTCFEMAYYSAHYPEYFWAAVLATNGEKADGVYDSQAYINEMLRQGTKFEFPSLQELERLPHPKNGKVTLGQILLGKDKNALNNYNLFLREQASMSIQDRIRFQVDKFGLCFTDNPINAFSFNQQFDKNKRRQTIVGQNMSFSRRFKEYYFLTLDGGQLLNVVVPTALLANKSDVLNSKFLEVNLLRDEGRDSWQATQIERAILPV